MGPPKRYAFDFKGKIIAKIFFVVSPAIDIIRSIVALRSGRAVFDLRPQSTVTKRFQSENTAQCPV
jgi:hypothetical protein